MKRNLFYALFLIVLCCGCGGLTIDLPGQPVVEGEVNTAPPQPQPAPESDREVLFFTQKGCAPCEAAKPQVEELRKQGLKVTEVWYHENPELFRQYGVSSTPTFIILQDGVEIERTGDIVLLITILVKILAWVLPLVF